jgi:peptidoglycan-associated lipoprotein
MPRHLAVLSGLAAVAVIGGSCHHRVAPAAAAAPAARPTATAPAVPRAPGPPPAPAAARAPAPLSEDELFRRKSLDKLNAERPLADVFFDYDQNVLREDGRAALQRDASWLARWPSTRILVEGHCDERGTAEYNLALGERRAAAVRDYLVSLGVKPERIEVRSLGKEAPFCRESGESCWSQNRRGHFVITAK